MTVHTCTRKGKGNFSEPQLLLIQHYDFIETVSFMNRWTDRWMDRKKDKRKEEMEGKTEDQERNILVQKRRASMSLQLSSLKTETLFSVKRSGTVHGEETGNKH